MDPSPILAYLHKMQGSLIEDKQVTHILRSQAVTLTEGGFCWEQGCRSASI